MPLNAYQSANAAATTQAASGITIENESGFSGAA
jgi:hypothetical protein